VIAVPEDPPPPDTPETPADSELDLGGGDISPADGTRLTDTIVGRFADQARRTASAARSGRLMNADGESGVLDLTPLRELAAELVEEFQKVRLRDRIARALRQAADIIDSQTPSP
jgi:thiamine monophosphate kinase